eukprot:1295765-Rhodomonas_salina.2
MEAVVQSCNARRVASNLRKHRTIHTFSGSLGVGSFMTSPMFPLGRQSLNPDGYRRASGIPKLSGYSVASFAIGFQPPYPGICVQVCRYCGI